MIRVDSQNVHRDGDKRLLVHENLNAHLLSVFRKKQSLKRRSQFQSQADHHLQDWAALKHRWKAKFWSQVNSRKPKLLTHRGHFKIYMKCCPPHEECLAKIKCLLHRTKESVLAFIWLRLKKAQTLSPILSTLAAFRSMYCSSFLSNVTKVCKIPKIVAKKL